MALRQPLAEGEPFQPEDLASVPGRFYSLLVGLVEEQSEDQLYRRQVLGLLQSISTHLQSNAIAMAAKTGLHYTDSVRAVLAV